MTEAAKPEWVLTEYIVQYRCLRCGESRPIGTQHVAGIERAFRTKHAKCEVVVPVFTYCARCLGIHGVRFNTCEATTGRSTLSATTHEAAIKECREKGLLLSSRYPA